MKILPQSTSFNLKMGPFVSIDDAITPITGISDVSNINISKNHGTFASRNSASSITPDGINGYYTVPLSTTDTNTLGSFFIESTNSGSYIHVFDEYTVVPTNVYNSLVGGTDNLQVSVTTSGIGRDSFELISELSDVPSYPINPLDADLWVFERSFHKNTATSGLDTIYKADGSTVLAEGVLTEDSDSFTRSKYTS